MEKYTYQYPHPAVATDCVVFGFDGYELKVLLIERGLEPFKGMWAFPGGFLRMNETAEECILRELKEETGLELKSVKQLGTFSGINRDPRERVISIAFYSLSPNTEVHGGDDASKAHWWSLDDIPQLAFDHDYILRQAMRKLRQDIHFEPVGFDLLKEQFTMAELQRLYESILGIHFDRRNFYKKMLQTGILREVNDSAPTGYFGKHNEMKRMDIDNLFADNTSQNCFTLDTTENQNNEFPLPQQQMPLADVTAIHSTGRIHSGRKGKLYQFDKEGYDRMKEDGSFRLEF